MRLSKKIYPFAIIISLILVLIVFYILNQGHFEKTSHSSIRTNIAKENNVLYIGYDMVWNGYGEPKLTKVLLLNEAGNELHQVNITPFIETSDSQITGVLTEVEVKKGNYDENYTLVNDYKIANPQFRLVLKVEFSEESELNNIAYFQIQYNTFGIMKEQKINVANQF